LSTRRKRGITSSTKLALMVAGACTWALAGCSPDQPTAFKTVPPMRSALLDAPNILSQAEAGTLGRGEQDYLVRFERSLPGFGGLFIHAGHVNVYLKGSSVSPGLVRSVLAKAYSTHSNLLVRDALVGASEATILPAAYSLSELISIEQRVASSRGLPTGYVGVGTALQDNRVKVLFADSAALLGARPSLEANGVPLAALELIVTGPAHLQNGNFDQSFRPTGGGIQIVLGNDTRVHHTVRIDPVTGQLRTYYVYSEGSLGYNVRSSAGADYFLTASHIANVYSGTNGAVGDTVWQPLNNARTTYSPQMGTITINPAWGEGAACDINPQTGTNFDFCTNADAMLGTYASGISFARRIATSTYEGQNGQVGTGGFHQFNDVVNVFTPEYVDDTLLKGANKTGQITSTTGGEITFQDGTLDIQICWPATGGCPGNKWLRLKHLTQVHATSYEGDSGGPVFSASSARNGAPYAALGILVAGEGAGKPCTGSLCYFDFARWDQIEPHLGLGTLNPRTTIP
jgi:hypothetical protein